MSDLSTTMAKLSGIRKALIAAMSENVSRNRRAGEVKTRATFPPDHVEHLLHEEGVSIPTNLAGVAYVPFPKGSIEVAFHVLQRELRAIYKI